MRILTSSSCCRMSIDFSLSSIDRIHTIAPEVFQEFQEKLADSLDTAALMLHTAHTFFLSVGMRIGASKCGLLPLFNAPIHKRDGTLNDRFVRCDGQGNHLFSTRTSVDATEIPIVDSYKYLGLERTEVRSPSPVLSSIFLSGCISY